MCCEEFGSDYGVALCNMIDPILRTYAFPFWDIVADCVGLVVTWSRTV